MQIDVVEPLSWKRRLRIMIGVAHGLDYLHSSKEQVVHGGIKTYNILLDQVLSSFLGAISFWFSAIKVDEFILLPEV